MVLDSSDDERPAVSIDVIAPPKDKSLIKRIYNYFFDSDEESEDGDTEHPSDTPLLKTIDFNAKTNAIPHHTTLYGCMNTNKSVVLRRGQPFKLTLTFTKQLDETDKIYLDFAFGPGASITKGTKVTIPVTQLDIANVQDWKARIQTSKDETLDLEVHIPVTAGVGVWNLCVRHIRGDTRNITNGKTDVYILFNPWCKDDSVYMEESQLDEYILNDSGVIYTGTYRKPQGRPWTFGQFDKRVLPAIMVLLENLKILRTERGIATKMVNAVSKINCLGKNSLMIERKDGNYSRGTAPYSWTSSADILDKYIKEEKPVSYGQCWVFSAVTTTICRALGIPSRSVTNFVSANDTNGTLFVDKFFDTEGNEVYSVDDSRPDTIWCFHAWNEVWMTRPDLDKDTKLDKSFDGWQAIDTTPQVECPTTYCGPAPVLAIREGKILDYNTALFYMEVNSDIVHWIQNETSEWKYSIITVNKCHVGRMIVTKDPETHDVATEYLNIVENYVKSDAPEDRDVVKAKIRGNTRTQKCFNKEYVKGDVHFQLKDVEILKPGQDLNVKLIAANNSELDRTVKVNLAANAVYYTGHYYGKINRSKAELLLKPEETQEIIVNVPYDDYWPLLREFSIIRTTAFATVKETGLTWSDEDDLQVEKPKLRFTVKGDLSCDKECNLEIAFLSPVKTTLTGCKLTISSPGMRTANINFINEIQPLDTLEYTYTFRPDKAGKKTITAALTTNEYLEVTGYKTLNVN